MQRTITIDVVVSGPDNTASDYEAKIQKAAQDAVKALATRPLVHGATSPLQSEAALGDPTATARVVSVLSNSGGISDA